MILRQWLIGAFLFVVPLAAGAFSTPPDSSSAEWIKVYFNMPADYSAALPGNMSKSSHDLIESLETLIQSAGHSIDLAIYDLEHPCIGRPKPWNIFAA